MKPQSEDMHSINVSRVIKAPIERVFDIVADHTGYSQFPGVRKATLVKNGKPNKNGVGAIREIDAGLAWFREEITVYSRPTRLDYLIIESRPPLEHRGGSMRLEKTPEGTRLTWTSACHVKLPLIGPLITPLFVWKMRRSFEQTLGVIARRAGGG